MKRNVGFFIFVFFITLQCMGCQKTASITNKEVTIGGIFDLTGPTKEIGSEYADGAIDYIRYVNDNGGINGRKINFLYKDCEYKVSNVYSWYEELKRRAVISIIGWGTGETEALAPKISVDKIPFISASYSEKLANAKKYPFNFIGAVSYSDQARVAIKFIKNQETKENPNAELTPIAFIYNNTAFGRSPFFPAAEEFAKENGFKRIENIVVPLSGKFAKERLQEMNAKWAIVQETTAASIAIINAIRELNKDTKLVFMNWGIDEHVAKQFPNMPEGRIYGTIPYGVWSDTDLPAIKELHAINAKYHPNNLERTCRYIQGYINAKTLLEAVKNAKDDLTPMRIKEELENLKDFNTEASFNRVTFSKDIHKPSASIKIYKLAKGKITPLPGTLLSVERKIWKEY